MRGRAAGAEEVRRHNLSAVLEPLHLGGPRTRSELAAATGLNRSTIADLLAELATLGLVRERSAPTPSGPGRPSPVVYLRPAGAAVLAVEIAVDSIAVATMGIGGHVFNLVRVARPRRRFPPEETVEDVAKLAGPLLASLPAGCLLAGVGVAVVGITRRSDGFVHLAPNLGWHDVPLAAMLSSELQLGVRVSAANEADLGALAEHRRVRPDVANLVYVSCEAGIGAGIILDGRPLLGAAGYAGEFGHTLKVPDGRPCGCGAVGCWETEAGEAALLRRLGLGSATGRLDEVARMAAAGDERTLGAIAEVGLWLGLGIGDLINVFNPELVVLGGLYHRLFSFLEDSVLEGASRRGLSVAREMATITSSGLGVNAPLIGAAELVLSGVIGDPASLRRDRDGRAGAADGGTVEVPRTNRGVP